MHGGNNSESRHVSKKKIQKADRGISVLYPYAMIEFGKWGEGNNWQMAYSTPYASLSRHCLSNLFKWRKSYDKISMRAALDKRVVHIHIQMKIFYYKISYYFIN